jgi:hypothetical protein
MGSVVAIATLLGVLSAAQAQTQPHPILRWNVKHDVSAPLSEMIKNAPKASLAAAVKHEAEPVRRIPLPPGMAEAPVAQDLVRQQQTIAAATPTTSLNFEGLGNAQYGFTVNSAPPDTNGAVGATQYLQLVNSSFAVFNKSNGALIAGPTATNTLWSGFGGGCQTNDDGDGIALYDKQANRWVISQFSVSTTPFLQCVAVSTTSDATGTYNRYSFQYSNFDDYPKMGIWPDGYYVTFNMFNGNTFVGADSCAYNRTAMLAGTAATQVCFQQGSAVGGLLPSDFDGLTAPPAGSPNYQVYFGNNSLQLYKFHVDFTTPANSTYTGPTNIPVSAFSPLCGGGTCIVQPSGGNQLDSLADRLMFRLAYRNLGSHESLVVNHSIVSGTSGGVRWYEIQNPSGTPVVAQQSTFAPDASYRWMGSIAMDQAGDIALGYSVSSSSLDPTVRYTGRLASDPVNTMGAEVTTVTGGGVQNGSTSNGPLTRWGDYSSMTVDPVDDCTFWYTQEYIKTTGSFNWSTRISNFKFPGCGGAAPTASLSPTSLTFASRNVGTTSAAQTITLSNGGTAALAITSIAATGDYAQTNTCGTSLAASANCTISVTFTPTAAGTRTGTLTVTDNAAGSPQTASLTGTGTAVGPSAALSPTSLTFASQTVGTTSAAQAITLSNGGTAALSITSIAATGDYVQTNNCGTSVAAGASCSISVTFTPTTTGTRTGAITVTDNATSSPQSANLTGTGASAGGTQTAAYDSTLKALKCGTLGSACDSGPSLLLGRDTLSGGAEPNQPNTINSSCADGTSGTFHSDESNDRILVATTDGTNFTPGKTIKVSATVWAYSGFTSDALDLYYAANASSPTWVLIATIVPPAAGAQTLSANYTLPSGGTLQAVRANFRYQGAASSCSTGAYDDHDDLVFTVGAGTPGFTVSAAPGTLAINQGGNGTSTITVASQNSFSAATTLGVSGLPTGVTAAFSTNPVTPPANGTATSVLTLTASATATTGPATLTVTGTSGSTTASTTIALTINPSGTGPQTAAYDTVLKTTKCAAVGSSCDSGASLLLGRDSISGGAEQHQPNTINSSCADGTSGTFHSDESNDRIVVATTDGSALTHGKIVKVTATVWAWNTGSSDSLDIYYTANANSPTWILIGTIKPTAGGAQSLSTTYTLPTGALQAIRANFRYLGSASSCSTGAYDDHDDLVFAVN